MIYDIQFSSQAENDLRNIYEYISFSLKSGQSAIGQLNRLEKAINSLNQMPDRYRAYSKEPWHSRGLRVMPVDNYIIFYIPNHHAKVVYIVRILYGGRDIDTQISRFTAFYYPQKKHLSLDRCFSLSRNASLSES